jgi:hypothetical protein
MANYTKIVDYAAKDALNTGDPAKLIKGTEIGAEYDAIATAIATKANSASPVFTGISSFAVGAVGAPSIYMTGYATTGWYNIGANNWGFAVSGAKVLDIASTGLSVSAVLATFTLSATGASNPLMYLTTTRAFGVNRNWQIGVDQYAEGHWTLTPSTAQGGSTYTTPLIDVSSTGLAVTGALSATGTLSTVGLITSTAAAQSALFNNAVGSYATWQYGGTSVGDVGTANQAVSGGSTADFAITSRAGNLILGSGTTTRVTVSSTGLAVTGTTSTTTGMAVGGATAGAGGIAFPATAVAVADVNTLDDYEEGSWTPSQGSGLTLVGAFSSTGKYTKIGNVVTVTGTVSGATSVACASVALLTENLPFQASITGRGTGVAVKSGLDGACFFITGTNGISTFTAITACPTIFFSATYLV